ncbi:MAG: DUF501 domain-containing protein [Acidimicrobiales bacterium]
MTEAAVVLAAGRGSRFEGAGHKLRAEIDGTAMLLRTVNAARAAGYDDVVVVVGDDDFADLLPSDVLVIRNPDWAEGQSTSLQAAAAHARAHGHDAFVVSVADQPLVGVRAWRAIRGVAATPIIVSLFDGLRRTPTRLAAEIWDRLPSRGDAGARGLISEHPELVTTIPSFGDPTDVDTVEALEVVQKLAVDRRRVSELLGREPQGAFAVVVRDATGGPVVLRNAPILHDGTPMPTLYWLCGERENVLVGRLESMGGVRRAEAEVGLDAIADAHDRYREERDAALDAMPLQPQHRPSGGVGGTRTGVKCLHAHYGWWLAGGDDPVGEWVAEHLHEVDRPDWPAASREDNE